VKRGESVLRIDDKKEQLVALYEEFEREITRFRAQAVCIKGCADCCIQVGTVAATTLEGMVIREYLEGWSRQSRETVRRRLRINRSEKLTKVFARCAFLDEEQACTVYPVRPFSCRRLYSVKTCGEQGPVIHRRAMALASRTIAALRDLDPAGCSGHLSFVLHLLDNKEFRRAYLQGLWDPGRLQELVERYQLTVHAEKMRSVGPRLPLSG
jgi:Fe-S-cluster containining protein